MTIWFALFILIIIASFILAYLSMKDYQETPAKHFKFGIFLIQDPHNLSNSLLKALHADAQKQKAIITIERLFKGSKSALLITGQKSILEKYLNQLNLLELEDFTNIDQDKAIAWEVGVKEDVSRPFIIEDIFKDLPEFETEEQFWWQLTLQTSPIEKHSVVDFLVWLILAKKTNLSPFQCQIRAVIYSPDSQRRQLLADELEKIGDGKLIKVPRPVTSSQILQNYKLRSITPQDPYLLSLTEEEVLSSVGGKSS